jgi:ABC-type polysaccharide/polyol phosphate export permease
MQPSTHTAASTFALSGVVAAWRPARRVIAVGARHELLRELVRKDFDVRYAGSVFGVLWTQLYPLLLLGVYSFVFSVIFTNTIQHFPLFLFSGIALWSFFSTSVLMATGAILANHSLVIKVGFPRELLVFSAVLIALLDLGASHIILFAGALWFGIWPSWSWLALPFIILIMTVFCAGLGLILSTAAVYLRDVRFFTEVAVMLLMFLTPVFYSQEAIPESVAWVRTLNPLAGFVTAYRQAFMSGVWPSPETWVALIAPATVAFLIGIEVFDRGQHGFPDAL